MKQILPLCTGMLLSWSFAGCVPEESAVPYNEVYVFDRIEYFLAEQDGSFDRQSDIRTAGGINHTSGGGIFTFYPLINIDEECLFSTDALEAYTFEVPQDRLIPIPQEISGGQISLSEPKAVFDISLPQYFSGDWNEQKVRLYIPPLSELAYDYIVLYKELQTGFRAVFIEKEYRTELTVEGRWKGNRILGTEGESSVRPAEG